MRFTIKEFALKIRNLNPGDSDNLSDEELVRLWLEKNPNDIDTVETIHRKPFYSGFWFWFWTVLALLFFIGSFKDKTLSIGYILIIMMYVFYNGFMKKESWWADSISRMLSKKAWNVVFIILIILLIAVRAIIMSFKNH
jgi:hypothetical protein